MKAEAVQELHDRLCEVIDKYQLSFSEIRESLNILKAKYDALEDQAKEVLSN